MIYPESVKLVEVGPRDGLQNEKRTLPPDVIIELIHLLSAAGLRSIESGAFVSPKWVPQMAASAAVLKGISRKTGVSYPVLVPNLKGYEAAADAGVSEIAVFAAASESFSRKNINCSIKESLQRFTPVIARAHQDNVKVRGYISCVLGCPYEGVVDPQRVAKVTEWLLGAGCYEVSLGDTIGTGNPSSTGKLLDAVLRSTSETKLAVHFHDTYGQALGNIVIALQRGISVIDCSVSGLGGCPYAEGAAGNVATEDVLYMLNGMGIKSGVDMQLILKASRFIDDHLGRHSSSKATNAMRKS